MRTVAALPPPVLLPPVHIHYVESKMETLTLTPMALEQLGKLLAACPISRSTCVLMREVLDQRPSLLFDAANDKQEGNHVDSDPEDR